MRYSYYHTSSLQYNTLSELCSAYHTSVDNVLRVNTQDSSVIVEGTNEYKTVSQILQECQVKGLPLPNNITIRLPYYNSGAKDISDTFYNISSGYNQLKYRTYQEGGQVPSINIECYMYILLDGSRIGSSWSLPVIPQEFSDTNKAEFSPTSILGRSVDYQTYQSSTRSVSFNLTLHEELCSNYNYIHELVSVIESANYPGYSEGVVKPPEICFIIGSQFRIRGILDNCSVTWKTPIIDGRYSLCELNLGITETTGPWSQYEVQTKGGRRI